MAELDLAGAGLWQSDISATDLDTLVAMIDGDPGTPNMEEVRRRVYALTEWIEGRDWKGFDPYDGIRTLPFRPKSQFVRQVQVQTLKRSPLNIRRVFGAEPYSMSKSIALGLMAMRAMGDTDRASRLQSRLLDARLDGGLWGYEFDVQTRWAFYPAGTANAIATSFAVHALLDGGPSEVPEGVLSEIAVQLRTQLLSAESGRPYFRYVDRSGVLVHNANLLTAAALARVAVILDLSELGDIARAAAATSLRCQSAAGSWAYGEARNLGWVDGIHTAYVLIALDWLGDCGAKRRLESGLEHYTNHLFGPDGRPLSRSGSRAAGDVHTVATALWALSRFPENLEAMRLASLVFRWSDKIRKTDGSYALSRYNPISYMRWGQAHMLLGLVSYLKALDGREE